MSSPLRIIPRLDIKGENLVKGLRLEGLRILGQPKEFAQRYYEAGADELLLMDVYASLLGRNQILDVVQSAAKDLFIPLTVGGGIRTIEDVVQVLRAGADKVAINTAAIDRPQFLRDVAQRFGAQCVVLSIEAKRRAPGSWEAFTNNGREATGVDVLSWAAQAQELGAGEILVTSVDREGTRKGYDNELAMKIRLCTNLPVIFSGGAGSVQDMITVKTASDVDALSAAWILHYGITTIAQLKARLYESGICVRPQDPAIEGTER